MRHITDSQRNQKILTDHAQQIRQITEVFANGPVSSYNRVLVEQNNSIAFPGDQTTISNDLSDILSFLNDFLDQPSTTSLSIIDGHTILSLHIINSTETCIVYFKNATL